MFAPKKEKKNEKGKAFLNSEPSVWTEELADWCKSPEQPENWITGFRETYAAVRLKNLVCFPYSNKPAKIWIENRNKKNNTLYQNVLK